MLRDHSRVANRKLVDVASAVVDSHLLLPKGESSLPDGSLSPDLHFARWVPCPFARSTIRAQSTREPRMRRKN
jgi:hypothetical protein